MEVTEEYINSHEVCCLRCGGKGQFRKEVAFLGEPNQFRCEKCKFVNSYKIRESGEVVSATLLCMLFPLARDLQK